MPAVRPITLSASDDERRCVFLQRGKANARTFTRARVLLKLSAGWSGAQIVAACDVSPATVTNVRTRLLRGGLEAVLSDKRQERRRQALTGAQQAHLSAIACSDVQRRAHWTRPLDAADAGGQGRRGGLCRAHRPGDDPVLVEQNHRKPWQQRAWRIPTVSAEFVAAMEEVLDWYAEPYDPAYPTNCLDEKPVVLPPQTRAALPLAPGHVVRRDDEYGRQGTADLFVMVEPLIGWRQGAVTEQRTRRDFAECVRSLVEERSPAVDYPRLVVDNLNTHVPAARDEAFPPQRARAILERLAFHDTPKHGRWLNMAEIEISVFERGCLARPVADVETLDRRVKTLEAERNAARCTIHWQFTSQQARTKLVDLYPVKQT
jgi:hypothetical protein